MNNQSLRGVIAALPTPLAPDLGPDIPACARLAADLLDNGCDALNVLGTTGEATSFSVAERLAVMAGLASALPTARLMVGTGAAAITDAVALTRRAGELGFAGALLLPPFYYKGVPAEGVLAYLEVIARETADTGIALYLYNFPALSGVPYTPEIVAEAMRRIGPRLAGLKDSSGDLAYCRALAGLPGGLAVFPSNEAALIEARTGIFAGCISASANTNADLCHKAFHAADAAALGRAVAIRALFDGLNLVSAVKGLLSVMRNEPGLARTRPPLVALAAARSAELAEKAAAIRAG